LIALAIISLALGYLLLWSFFNDSPPLEQVQVLFGQKKKGK
jgi:hypothetical protein